jgi:hypothetical protein
LVSLSFACKTCFGLFLLYVIMYVLYIYRWY